MSPVKQITTENNPAALCAAVEMAGGRKRSETQYCGAASQPIAEGVAKETANPTFRTPSLDMPIVDVAAIHLSEPNLYTPHVNVPYTPVDPEIIADIIDAHRQRQAVIKAKTKLQLQALAVLRSVLTTDADMVDDDTKQEETAFGTKRRKLSPAAAKRVEAAMKLAATDPTSEYHLMVMPYLVAQEPLEKRQSDLEKLMVKAAKRLPVYEWVKTVKGLGDVSFATIVGECGDIGSYRNPSCVWKRMGLAVINGNRQGAPGKGASAEDWIEHGYSGKRRSVSWNARNGLILGMGKWRPMFGEDVRANPDLTEYQMLFAERARIEAVKLDKPVTESDKGKESYSAHVVARAMRYVEKRMLRELWINWRRTARG